MAKDPLSAKPTMSPSWRFRDVPPLQRKAPATHSFYQRQWPDDLPSECGVCGTEFRFGFNLTIGPGRIGRILRKIAYFGFLPFLAIGLLLPGIAPEMIAKLSGHHGWWAIFGAMFFPPMLFGGLSVIMPQTRLVECKKCGWSHDYKIRKFEPLPPDP